MEVDEAASHIKELVDPDANIIWGSAFNNDLDGKIRVSVVATGIDAEVQGQVPAAPAKVFTFPTARTVEPKPAAAAPAAPAMVLTPPESLEEDEAPTADVAEAEESAATEDELDLAGAETAGSEDELLLGDIDMVAEEPAAEDEDEAPAQAATGNRSWLSRDEEEPAPAPKAAAGGTLFERMSNIARGAAKAQVEEEPQAPRLRTSRDPLDIPRFLNRQNNQ
jgi:cell division protein FtsZ